MPCDRHPVMEHTDCDRPLIELHLAQLFLHSPHHILSAHVSCGRGVELSSQGQRALVASRPEGCQTVLACQIRHSVAPFSQKTSQRQLSTDPKLGVIQLGLGPVHYEPGRERDAGLGIATQVGNLEEKWG